MSVEKNKNIILLIISTVAIAVFGCIMVYSASKYAATVQYNNQFFYLKKQIIGVVLGFIGLAITSLINNKVYKKFYWAFYVIGIVFLVLVFVPGLEIGRAHV